MYSIIVVVALAQVCVAQVPACASSTTNVCCDSAVSSYNKCYNSIVPAEGMKFAGVILHGWDGTEAKDTPWVPGSGQGSTGYRWSASSVNSYTVSKDCQGSTCTYPSTVSIFNIFNGGIIFNQSYTVIPCVYPADSGTDSRLNSGCGSRSTPTDWCGDKCSFQNPAQCTGTCTVNSSKLGAVVAAQYLFSQSCSTLSQLRTCYNEIVVEPAVQNEPWPAGYNPDGKAISAFFQPVNSDPNLMACPSWDQKAYPSASGGTQCCAVDPVTRQQTSPANCIEIYGGKITCHEMCLYAKKFPTNNVPLVSLNPTNLTTPFSMLCSTFAECVSQKICLPASC